MFPFEDFIIEDSFDGHWYNEDNGRTYYFHPGKSTWATYKEKCKSLGLEVATFEIEDNLEWIIEKFVKFNIHYILIL